MARRLPNLPLLPELAAALQTTVGNALTRAARLKIAPVCDRCGGCGSYSFNQVDGSTCYGCNGIGHRVPKANEMAALVAEAKRAAEDGRLEAYLRTQDAAAKAKAGWQAVMDVYAATPMQRIYAGWASHVYKQADVGGNWDEMRKATHAGHEAFKLAEAAIREARFAKFASPDWSDKQVAAAKAIDDAIATIRATAIEPSPEVIAFAQAKQRAAVASIVSKGRTPGFKVYGEE